jgi:manganese efflux pump family protein
MGIRNRPDDQRLMQRITSWQGLMLLAATLSLDNLVVGFSLGMRRMDPWIVATTIAVFSAAFTWLGLKLGRAARRRWETYAEVLAGLMLVALGAATALGWL